MYYPVFDTTGEQVTLFGNKVGIAYQAIATDANQDTVTYAVAGIAPLWSISFLRGGLGLLCPYQRKNSNFTVPNQSMRGIGWSKHNP